MIGYFETNSKKVYIKKIRNPNAFEKNRLTNLFFHIWKQDRKNLNF